MAISKGKFKPKNPSKYKGNPTNIIYRSSWEFKYMLKLDSDDKVIAWSSEEITVPYKSPMDNRFHRYFVDFYVERYNDVGKIEKLLIEIKPSRQCKPPKIKVKKTKKYINEIMTWGINNSKWKSAENYCKDRGWKFQILTEIELGIKI